MSQPTDKKDAARSIDLNCDAGERFGTYRFGQDKEIFPYVSSCNIACGFHAGDPTVMRETVEWALENDLLIGAHPGYADLLGFGRRQIDVSPTDLGPMILYQVGALQAVARSVGGRVSYVKLHGALYHRAAYEEVVAETVVDTLRRLGDVFLLGPPDCPLETTAQQAGLSYAREAFADRRYAPTGRLMSRKEAGAVIHDPEEAARQAAQLAQDQLVVTPGGAPVNVSAHSICLHGDHPNALAIARQIRHVFDERAIRVAPLSRFIPKSHD